ncbi:hypothetical protein AcV5_006410 [Taiwanofungus camphoratus]|nr:hypothetical protein AcW2_004851 [Antrodia cinnamomea]KAI0934630.1 hypothetical protein AcV5_006410 [Antrodia cinnamomea]KAI0950086.1 hypothetical protein AcV7_008658 [Antrodia cinnamomea]
MSETSGDELANYDPTTPAKPIIQTRKASTRSNHISSRAAAGPSSKPFGVPSKRGSKRQTTAEVEETLDDQIVIGSSSEDGVDNAVSGQAKGRKAQGRSEATSNGRTRASTTKGKGKAEPPSKHNRTINISGEPMEIDDRIIEADHDLQTIPRTTRGRTNTKPPKANATSTQQARDSEKLLHDLEHLRKQLDSVISEKDKLSRQLEELFQVRHTEPEQALEQQSMQYEARLQTQESLINELTSQLAKVKTLSGSEKKYMLHFLTREAADEEKEAIEREVGRWKDVVKDRDIRLADKDKRIAELEAQENVLRSDLQAEIDRGKHLASRNPPAPVTRNYVKITEDPKNAQVIRLYEDMTNFLVVSAKIEKGAFLNLDEPVFTCVYTYREEESSDRDAFTLNFYLKESWERAENSDPEPPITSKDQLVQKVRYQPLNLQMEPEDFINKLDFFKDAFIFSRDQLPVFLKTLSDRLGDIARSETEQNELDDDEVVVIN